VPSNEKQPSGRKKYSEISCDNPLGSAKNNSKGKKKRINYLLGAYVALTRKEGQIRLLDESVPLTSGSQKFI